MVELYVARGMTEADAENVIDVMAKYPNFFLDVMMVEELGLMPPDDGESPAKNGLVTFLAFVCFGFVPLTSYVLAGVTGASADANFIAACVLTALMMLALGAAKAKFTNQSTTRSAALMLLNGSIAATAAYLVSWGISSALLKSRTSPCSSFALLSFFFVSLLRRSRVRVDVAVQLELHARDVHDLSRLQLDLAPARRRRGAAVDEQLVRDEASSFVLRGVFRRFRAVQIQRVAFLFEHRVRHLEPSLVRSAERGHVDRVRRAILIRRAREARAVAASRRRAPDAVELPRRHRARRDVHRGARPRDALQVDRVDLSRGQRRGCRSDDGVHDGKYDTRFVRSGAREVLALRSARGNGRRWRLRRTGSTGEGAESVSEDRVRVAEARVGMERVERKSRYFCFC
eukprot:30825-Pelagococcus_subviridis.AAC.4